MNLHKNLILTKNTNTETPISILRDKNCYKERGDIYEVLLF